MKILFSIVLSMLGESVLENAKVNIENSFVNRFSFLIFSTTQNDNRNFLEQCYKKSKISLYYNISFSLIITNIINIQTYIWHYCFHSAGVWLLHFVAIIKRGNVQERTSSFIVYRSILHFFKLLIDVVHNQIGDLLAKEISMDTSMQNDNHKLK